MNRRKAIKYLGTGISAGWVFPSLLSSCKKDDPGPEINYAGTIAIIGGGASGLYAADILKAKGLNVVVFEATAQLGGRVRSLRNQHTEYPVQSIADFPVELGAEILYGSDSTIAGIAKNFNLPLVDLDAAVPHFILDNTAKSAGTWGNDSDLSAVTNFLSSLSTYSGPDVSVMQAAATSARGLSLLNSRIGNFYGTSSQRLGVKGLSEELKVIKRNSKWLTVSTNPLQDILLSRFNDVASKAKLSTPIVSINYSGEKIILTDKKSNQYEVDKVIVAIPLGVLKANAVNFTPALPANFQSASDKFGMDHCIRVVLDFKKNFWGSEVGVIWGGTTSPWIFNSGFNRSNFSQTLSITINGTAAEQLSNLTDADIVKAILSEIDLIYSGQGTQFVRRTISGNGTNGDIISFVKNWTKEEYIKGGWSYSKVDASLADRKSLATPIAKKLFFAGEATDIEGDSGTLNGAFNSAERVVDDVIKSILE